MPYVYRNKPVKLTHYARFEEREVTVDECPNCRHTRVSKSPRRKGGPSLFSCGKCGFIVNINDLFGAHWMLGHEAV